MELRRILGVSGITLGILIPIVMVASTMIEVSRVDEVPGAVFVGDFGFYFGFIVELLWVVVLAAVGVVGIFKSQPRLVILGIVIGVAVAVSRFFGGSGFFAVLLLPLIAVFVIAILVDRRA